MKTLGTAFKQVYEEALKEYGFKKIKGKYPYYVRLIGDEIIHIITYKNEWCPEANLKAFNVLGGVATVYRGKITLDKSPKYNAFSLNSNLSIYGHLNFYNADEEYKKKILQFEYETQSEEDMFDMLNFSLNVSKKNLFPMLKKAQSIKACEEYYRNFHPSLLRIGSNYIFERESDDYEINEGLLNVIIYGSEKFEDYVKIKRENYIKENSKLEYLMKIGKSGYTEEEFEKDRVRREQAMLKQIKNFESLVNESEWKLKVAEEMNRRKKANQEILRSFGLEI